MNKARTQPKALTDDIAVRKEHIDTLFNPPIGRSTFYKFVESGDIVKARTPSGYYLLNATRIRIGLPPLDIHEYRKNNPEKTPDISYPKRLAYTAMARLVPEILKIYPYSLFPSIIDDQDLATIATLECAAENSLETITDPLERIYYAAGFILGEELSLSKFAEK